MRDIANLNSSSTHEAHHYAIQKPEGFVTMEYTSRFLAGVPAQIHEPQMDVAFPGSISSAWTHEPPKDFGLLRLIPPPSIFGPLIESALPGSISTTQIHESRMNSGRRGSISSDTQSFKTAHTHLSIKSQPSIPGGLREFYRTFQ